VSVWMRQSIKWFGEVTRPSWHLFRIFEIFEREFVRFLRSFAFRGLASCYFASQNTTLSR